MYGFLTCFLVLAIMICFTTPFGDMYNGRTPRNSDSDFAPNFQENRNFQVQERSVGRSQQLGQNNGPYSQDRHTQTPIKVEKSRPEDFQTVPATPRTYVKPAPNTKYYFNATSSPDLDGRLTKTENKRKTVGYEDKTKMVYPTDSEEATFKPSIISRNCSFGLCDEVDNYPVARIQRILNRSAVLKQFFSTEIIPPVINRFGETNMENMCSTMSHTRFPKSAINMKDIEQILVNVENYQQGVVFETCMRSDGPCNYSENFPNDHMPICVQKYTVRKLMVVGKESDTPIFDDFKIPSCCVCTVQKQKR